MLVVLDLLDIIVLALFHYVASVVLDEGSFLSRENICSRVLDLARFSCVRVCVCCALISIVLGLDGHCLSMERTLTLCMQCSFADCNVLYVHHINQICLFDRIGSPAHCIARSVLCARKHLKQTY
jgi:hypothetical protein